MAVIAQVFQSTEQKNILRGLSRSLNDTVNTEESKTRYMTLLRSLVETEQVSTGTSFVKGLKKVFNDTVQVASNTKIGRSISRVFNETVSVGKRVFQVNVFQNNVFQGRISEAITLLGKVRTVTETVRINEALKKLQGLNKVITDTVRQQNQR